jgi:hypothetical protein
MAHWAELDENNIVVQVTVGDNNDLDEGYQWLIDNLGGTWVKTSYNAIGGKKRNPNTGDITDEPGFRKNYAGIGFTYDEVRDAFIPPKPLPSWVLDEESCFWMEPIPRPTDGKNYVWNEETVSWDERPITIPGIEIETAP